MFHIPLHTPVGMTAYTSVSTGYDAHAEARHRAQMAQAAVEAINLNVPSGEEMIEDNDNVLEVNAFRKKRLLTRMVKATVKVISDIRMASI